MYLVHVILYLLETDIVSTCCLWGLESVYASLKVSSGTEDGSSVQELKVHLPDSIVKTVDTIWILTPLLKTGLTWEGTHIRLEEPPECFP